MPAARFVLSSSRRVGGRLTVVALTASAGFLPAIVPIVASAAHADSPVSTTTYQPGTPQLATITNGTSAAPWNEWQGDPATPAYSSVGTGTVLPTYTPGGAQTGSGASAEPNVAVMPAAASGTDGTSPYPSGTVGTPGPLDGYCGTGNQITESAGSPVRQPSGTTLPLAPAYFPHIVQNADGSLTGYFDYRPKDADEAVEVARSTDQGKDWTYEGEALEQNPGACPSGDINDDGNGHPFVLTVGGVTRLYTLQRSAGDQQGVGMLVHTLSPTASNPLNGAPAAESVGIDPDAFVPAGDGVTVPQTGGVTVDVTSTGTVGSSEQLVAGGFVDLTQTPKPTASSVVTCTGVSATTLTGCTSAATGGESVNAGDLIEQVIGYDSGAVTVPAGPNTSTGDGGLGTINVVTTSGGATKGLTNSITGTTYNNNAPNRAYINGVAVFCSQANANPTTKMEDCTTGPGGSALNVATGAPITADPVIPATASMTSGLVAPDGIVGVLPSYPGAPSGSTIVMYTEKELNYFVAGTTTNSSSATFASSIAFTPSPYVGQDLPAISAANPVTVSMGDATAGTIVPVTCTGLTTGVTDTLTGCTVPTADSTDKYSSTSLIGAPGATTVPAATLALTGEGSTSTAKLFKNNEDLAVVRVAYTTDGVNFSTAGLNNGGVISGQSNGAGNYTDLTNPTNNVSPSNLNAYATPGTADTTELRWAGSAGSIITNPDGSYGLFLSGAWAGDGDSDAFNQVFYSSSTDGEHWSVPTTVVSTDYTFAASAAQDAALAAGSDAPLGISAYYSGRAYGPSVVQNADGTLTMMFAGYRIPKTVSNAGTVLGTNTASPYTIGATDPVAYRNILTETLTSSTANPVATTTTLTAAPDGPIAGQSVTYTATVGVPSPGTGAPTGTVTFGGNSGTLCNAVTVSDSSPDTASCTVSYPNAETDSVTATYSGDSNYATSQGALSETIGTKPSAAISFTAPSSGTYGGSDTLNATGGGSTAPVVFSVDSTSDAGACVISGDTVSYTGIGNCVVDANQAGDSQYGPAAQVQQTIAVSPAALTITADNKSVAFGSADPSFTYTTSGLQGSDSLTTTPTCGVSGDHSAVGSYSIVCSGADAGPDYTISYVAGTLTVTTAATTTSAVADNDPAVTGQEITFTSVVASADESATPTGTVEFQANGIDLPGCNAVALTSGTATCSEPNGLLAMNYQIVAFYSGDGSFAASDNSTSPYIETVNQAATSVALAADNNPIVTGQSLTLTATISAIAPGTTALGEPTGTVSFADGAGTLPGCGNIAVDNTGAAQCIVSAGFTPGSQSFTATYSGDANFTGSASSALAELVTQDATVVTVTANANPPATGQAAVYTATVAPVGPGSGTPTGAVTFTVTGGPKNAAVSCSGGNAVSLAGGTAVCTVPASALKVGSTYTVTASYSGDSSFTAATGSLTQTVARGSTQTTVTSSGNPSTSGASVTFTATVAATPPASGTPTGKVTFTIMSGNGEQATCKGADSPSLSGGTAKCVLATGALAASGTPYSVTASYGGSTAFAASSASTSQSVTAAPTTVTLKQSTASSVSGKQVTFTAVVAPATVTRIPLTGNVSFTVVGASGDSVSCTGGGALSGKRQTCTVAKGVLTSSDGPYTITAAYSGDINDLGSTATITHQVTPSAH